MPIPCAASALMSGLCAPQAGGVAHSAASSLSDAELNELAHLAAKTWKSTSIYDTDGAQYFGREETPANCSSIHALAARELGLYSRIYG